ncbi:MAG: GatB/YqeY domain-containing protein [Proteobacteria bacterium]|nr:GatB/YqeY domain-containing protein [Pseudomonadota bacterium]MBU1689034.1 GatB/YqeY domain-containing protein [Pseudomonadota bacterium]
MSLQESIQADLKVSMKAKTEARTSALRVLIGEFQRQPGKELSDQDVQGIIKKLIKSEQETLARSGGQSSDYLVVLESYLPRPVDEDEIRRWIGENLDLAGFGNKIQAMKPIMAHFEGAADGNLVRRILESL